MHTVIQHFMKLGWKSNSLRPVISIDFYDLWYALFTITTLSYTLFIFKWWSGMRPQLTEEGARKGPGRGQCTVRIQIQVLLWAFQILYSVVFYDDKIMISVPVIKEWQFSAHESVLYADMRTCHWLSTGLWTRNTCCEMRETGASTVTLLPELEFLQPMAVCHMTCKIYKQFLNLLTRTAMEWKCYGKF